EQGLVVRPGAPLADQFQVALVPAVQVAFQDIAGDLRGHNQSLPGVRARVPMPEGTAPCQTASNGPSLEGKAHYRQAHGGCPRKSRSSDAGGVNGESRLPTCGPSRGNDKARGGAPSRAC